MAWTMMQQKAIQTRNTNILVSAGAGSGKTAVLSERILQYCLAGNDIRRVLVLTFTNAAATEMKERIRKKLIEHQLYQQASYIDSAFITTFDAYSLALVKKYYYVLGIHKNIQIIDQSLLEIKKKAIIDELFEQKYKDRDETFLQLLRKYAKQNDEIVKKMIFEIYSKLELMVDEEDFVKQYTERFCHPKFLLKVKDSYEQLVLKEFNLLVQYLERLKGLCTGDADLKLQNSIDEKLQISSNVKDYDALVQWIEFFKLPALNSKSDEVVKVEKRNYDALLKKFKETYVSKYSSLTEAIDELKVIHPDVVILLDMALDLKNELQKIKYDMMAFDYMDIAKMAIRLVVDHIDIHDEISMGLDEILIDEYQDTSDIQETFIKAISRNNCYMVGDIKQSIYRFRNTNPYIFKAKYDLYEKEQQGIKIDLTHNFRSRKEVIENINLLFSSLMTQDCGDADYSLYHQMHYGQKTYESINQTFDFNMEIFSYDSDDSYTNEEIEAFICGNQIKKLMVMQPQVLGSEGYRPLEYSDIAILIDRSTSFITFKKIFEYLQIPLVIEADLDLNQSVLPKLFANILLSIAHIHQGKLDKTYYHALASIARSFLCGYSDQVVYDLVQKQSENELTEKIKFLAQLASRIPLDALFERIIEEFKVYEKLSLIGDIENSCVVLEYIRNIFNTMKLATMSISSAADYFSRVFDEGISLKYKLLGMGSNSVRIMTIHKSKGLEFPYCFYPMLSTNFNKEDLRKNYGLDSYYGVYIPYSDEANSNTILKVLVDDEARRMDISEKVRLLYVALTRAREKIYLISNNKEYNVHSLVKRNFSSFNEMIRFLTILDQDRQRVDLNQLGLTKDYQIQHLNQSLPQGQKDIIYKEGTFQSQIKENKPISKEMNELMSPALQRAITLGKRFHECLEVLDFEHLSIEDLPVDSFMKKTLQKILQHPVFKDIAKAKTYHEHEFYFDAYHGIIDLLCIYDDHIDIIDYKLSNTDSKEYLRQLGIYKMYVEQKTDLPISCYLLSIMKQEVKKVL